MSPRGISIVFLYAIETAVEKNTFWNTVSCFFTEPNTFKSFERKFDLPCL